MSNEPESRHRRGKIGAAVYRSGALPRSEITWFEQLQQLLANVLSSARTTPVRARRPTADLRWSKARFAELRPPLLTCEPVLTEAVHLLRNFPKRLNALQTAWRRGVLQVAFSGQEQCSALLGLMNRYRDLPMSLADACLVRMSELHAECIVWTLDSHFKTYRRHKRQVIPCLSPEN